MAAAVLTTVAEAPDLCVGPIGALCAARHITGGIGSGLGQTAASLAMAGIGQMFVDGARQATTAVLAALDASTRVDINAAWFRRNTGVLAAIAAPVVVGLFVLQVAGAVLRREPGGLARAVVGLGKALLGAALALAVTQAALVACDEIADAIAAAAGTTVTDAARRFMSGTYLAGPQVGPALQILLGLAVIVAAFLLWAVLLFRKAALLLVAVFAPVAFAGAAWDHTRGWVRRWVELVAALVFSKVVIVVVFVVGADAFGGAGQGSQSKGAALSDLLAGLLLLGIAAFSPWLTWRFVHWSGAEISEAMHTTVARSPVPATARAAAGTARQAAFAAAGKPPVGAAAGGAGVGTRDGWMRPPTPRNGSPATAAVRPQLQARAGVSRAAGDPGRDSRPR